MRFSLIVLTGFLFPFLLFGQTDQLPNIKKGSWTGKLKLTENTALPFQIQVIGKGRDYTISVINGSETITLENGKIINDSMHFSFPSFNSCSQAMFC